MMPESRKLRVFLCHSSNDKPAVRELYKRLKAEGWIDPWLDEEKLYPGQDWDLEIEKAVETTDAVIVFLSNNSVTKEGYVQRELRFLLRIADFKPEGTVFVIPVRLDDCPMPRRLSMWQYVDFFPEERKNWAYKRLLGSLKIRAEKLDITPANSAEDQAHGEAEEKVKKEQEERNQQKREEKGAGEKIVAEAKVRADIAKKRIFVSFDFDNDKALKDLIIGQSRLPDSPFEIIDNSLKEAAPMATWEDKARNAIKRSEIVLVMVGPNTHKAPGVLKEVNMAREENVKIVQIIGYKDGNYTPVPNAGTLYKWSWDNLKKLLS